MGIVDEVDLLQLHASPLCSIVAPLPLLELRRRRVFMRTWGEVHRLDLFQVTVVPVLLSLLPLTVVWVHLAVQLVFHVFHHYVHRDCVILGTCLRALSAHDHAALVLHQVHVRATILVEMYLSWVLDVKSSGLDDSFFDQVFGCNRLLAVDQVGI